MAISESHLLGDSIIYLEARGVLASQVQPQVVVRIRPTNFYCWDDTLAIVPTTIHRFHLGHTPLFRALPVIFSFVAARIHGVYQPDCALCDVLLRLFSSRIAVQMTAVSALELLLHMGMLFRPSESNEDVRVMHEWMLENPPEEDEEMDGDVHDYVLSEGLDAGHGVPARGSCLECFTYGRGDGVREEECVICLMEFDAQAKVSRMPCSHTFHSWCIIRWLETSSLCPICRSQMPTASSN
ncbi:uncharacterized protein [Elaeis guineensis]|uniref:Uncharacterized protein LOC114912798 n=1 Tax=Elaeis guineensis var. tenera TaxID=51953 RepID=A0A8N4I5R0_ELAGV|nr:uncharacterized protein LOC114912798 [Elaeis guineensis]